jgi:hypothetical protein
MFRGIAYSHYSIFRSLQGCKCIGSHMWLSRCHAIRLMGRVNILNAC